MYEEKDVIDMEVHYESRWEKFKHKWWKRKEKAKQWFNEDPRRILAVGSVVVVGGKKAIDTSKTSNQHRLSSTADGRRFMFTTIVSAFTTLLRDQ